LVDRGDDNMAAHAYSGPVAVQEAAAPPAMGAGRSVGEGATDTAKLEVKDADAPAADKDEDDEDGVWDTASLYEEILDEVEAFEYSGDGGTSGQLCATQHSN
jgi:NAD-dependent histone deacetylase SIR2